MPNTQPKGEEITSTLLDIHESLNLSTVIGHAPQDYFLARYPVTDTRSLLRKLMDDVLPSLIVDSKVEAQEHREMKRIYLANSGCQRFDIVSSSPSAFKVSKLTPDFWNSSKARSRSTINTPSPPSPAILSMSSFPLGSCACFARR